MAPVIRELKKHSDTVESMVCVTAQHREMLYPLLEFLGVSIDRDLQVMEKGQSLSDLTARVIVGMTKILEAERPVCVVTQGDTTTVLATAIAAFYQKIPVAHVEAGLRTRNVYSPYPEEMNRRLTGSLAALHFAPTRRAVENLLQEGVPEEAIVLTGNPVIDSLHWVLRKPLSSSAEEIINRYSPAAGRKLILVTAHRRESFGAPFLSLCRGLRAIVERNPDVDMVYPVHMNPRVREAVGEVLTGHPRIHLIEPLGYEPFCHLMNRAHIVLTDSGGVQEEAPALGKPVLVLREDTERPEAVESGSVEIVGTSTDRIVSRTEQLLHDPALYERMSRAVSPYGDGHAAERMAEKLVAMFASGDDSRVLPPI